MKRKRNKRVVVSSNFYSVEKIVYKKKQFQYASNPKGYLYSKATIVTKVKKEDLPDYFVPVKYKKCYGYLRVNKVKDIAYISRTSNSHFIKDDVLLISYYEPIIKDNTSGDLFGYQGYDLYVFGFDILTVLDGANKYSRDLDIGEIVAKINAKKELLKVTDYNAYLLEASHLDKEAS